MRRNRGRPSLLATAFVVLCELSPSLKSRLWRLWYQLLARRSGNVNLRFMNYGYAEDDREAPALLSRDEPFRYSIQLYHHVCARTEPTNKVLIDVGCGRGGGSDYIARYLKPQHVIGLDYASSAVIDNRRQYTGDNLSFICARSDALPFVSNSADIAINVESSHCYPDFSKFLAEVYRVLKPGGLFSFCDLRPTSQLEQFEKAISACGMERVEYRDITPNVIAGLNRLAGTRSSLADKILPRFARKAFGDFAGLPGTAVYDGLQNGRLYYVSLLLRKN